MALVTAIMAVENLEINEEFVTISDNKFICKSLENAMFTHIFGIDNGEIYEALGEFKLESIRNCVFIVGVCVIDKNIYVDRVETSKVIDILSSEIEDVLNYMIVYYGATLNVCSHFSVIHDNECSDFGELINTNKYFHYKEEKKLIVDDNMIDNFKKLYGGKRSFIGKVTGYKRYDDDYSIVSNKTMILHNLIDVRCERDKIKKIVLLCNLMEKIIGSDKKSKSNVMIKRVELILKTEKYSKYMLDGYRIRNKFVHGDKITVSDETIIVIINKIEDLIHLMLRTNLKYAIADKEEKIKMINEMED